MIRTFIAIELPRPVQTQLAELGRRLLDEIPGQCVRWARSEGTHLTLKFLGEVAESRLEVVASRLLPLLTGIMTFSVEVGGLGCFPDWTRPRVIWVGVRNPTGELQSLQREIEKSLSEIGFSAEPRQYSPHLTLGRVRPGLSREELRRIGGAVARQQNTDYLTMLVRGIALFESDLHPEGPVYTRRLEWRLKERP